MNTNPFRKNRRLKAKRGQRVTVDGRPGVIESFPYGQIGVRFDVEPDWIAICDPTWLVDYSPAIPLESHEEAQGASL